MSLQTRTGLTCVLLASLMQRCREHMAASGVPWHPPAPIHKHTMMATEAVPSCSVASLQASCSMAILGANSARGIWQFVL
eukprot:5712933-Amphidinium_carterae.1